MATGGVLDAFAAEAQSLASAMAGEPAAVFGAPSPCPPWTVGELFWHVANAADRVGRMLAEPEPEPEPEPEAGAAGRGRGDERLVSAAGYYQPDRRFSAVTNADRIATAQRGAAGLDPAGLQAAFDRAWRSTLAAAAVAPPGRRVRTRHGDLMLLTDFMRTRVLELAVHGLDLAAGVGQEPWLTGAAAGVVEELILAGQGHAAAVLAQQLGWDRAVLIAKATGRSPLTAAERRTVQDSGIRWLALG
jgi:uncharacterized protein (TIGR03083 family)